MKCDYGDDMSHEPPTAFDLPKPVEFRDWVEHAIRLLGKTPAEFLRDDQMPGSKNRVGRFLANPASIRLSMAHALERELIAQAKLEKVDIGRGPISKIFGEQND